MKKIYSSIDIGSDTIKFIVAEYYNKKVNILASLEVKSKGIRKGLIVDEALLTNAIKDGIKVINNDLSFDIKKVIVNVSSYNAKFIYVTGSVSITNDEYEITKEDVDKVFKASVYNKLPNDYELIDVMPIEFVLDDGITCKYPVGKISKKLQIKGIMIIAPKENVNCLIKVMEEAKLEVVDIVISGLADFYEVRNEFINDKVGAIINIGHETTTISIINNSLLVNTDVLKLGSLNIDKDLAYVFGISVFDGRVIKEKFASSSKRFSSSLELFEVKNTLGEVLKLNQLEISEVVATRMEEILKYAKNKMLEITKKDIEYIVITGGATEIKSFKQLVFEFLGKDVIIYTEEALGARNNKYTTAIGMIKYLIDKLKVRDQEYSMITSADESLLINPNTKKKEFIKKGRLFGSLHANKEEENE